MEDSTGRRVRRVYGIIEDMEEVEDRVESIGDIKDMEEVEDE